MKVSGEFERRSGETVLGTMPGAELHIFDGKGVNIAEKKEVAFVEVDPDTEIV